MRLRHIEVIQAILQTGNLTAAAASLDLPSTAVSATLQEAEQQLGYMLFAQGRGRLQPTREALALENEFNRLYDGLEHIRRLACDLRQHQDPPLRVVCTPTLAQQLLPQSVAALRRRFRETPCSLSSQSNQAIVRSLLLRDCDVGLSLEPCEHPAITGAALVQGKLQLLAPHGWLQPKQKYIALQDLAGQTMIGLDGEDPLRRLLENRLQTLRPAPLIQTRVQTYPMMRSMVEAGEGLAVVDPFTALGARAAGLDMCPIAPAIPVTLYALTLREHEASPALKTLLEILTEKAGALLASQAART
ncbi:LysR substrate-binding domain-containing protein [Pseudomonas sp. R5(2019)]|uniref:LysR substrate-binding domain-containing protein n=1 Tax=Pseudomonas sp. R5(2019) TaxID=2697566 RepID=UPI00141346FB|nr:LysR substrate-binding domain-containing protein [Pseudomonas sp. R5(2019)]NBA95951.1 LysR family transcriptional regulator [Pseudomonas sp. R5(2019)]